MTDFEVRAKELLPDYVWSYFSATAGGASDAESSADWSAIRFRPHVLRDVSSVDTTTSVLGTPIRTPILIAPMAQRPRIPTAKPPWRVPPLLKEGCSASLRTPQCRSLQWRLKARPGGSRYMWHATDASPNC